ncbi:MAG: Asp-tRNA(Asn)/Glu-tRNA(Gln) amidotransferase subunit GatC [Bryobacteraceae bacterium]|nr:Asp-tRNA(Asn)/Glu-tRNA(Gln) amidotransferase subunit GatC [Bryobacteraceae bacterium]MDW8379911.1 Asp-tRNA(Asn)/Glu-tRNA(Gln) amidotransferase subunit GatC [Bryobacterales bacterium]
MKITEQQVRYVAELAHLRLSDQEVQQLARDLDEILSHMEKLNELDTENVEPMAQVLYEAGETATLREDCEQPTIPPEIALANAPLAGAGYFKVPKVIDK